MAKALKKLLPKDFEDLLGKGDIAALKSVFESCELNARGGYAKQTALAFAACPDELARWLVAQGADLSAADSRGNTPLHTRSRSWRGRIEVLLELGANSTAPRPRSARPCMRRRPPTSPPTPGCCSTGAPGSMRSTTTA